MPPEDMSASANGALSVCSSQPLQLWDKAVQNGHIKRVTDDEIQSFVIEILGANVSTTFITCPLNRPSLGIKLPILVMIVKNVRLYFPTESMHLSLCPHPCAAAGSAGNRVFLDCHTCMSTHLGQDGPNSSLDCSTPTRRTPLHWSPTNFIAADALVS